MLDIHHPGVDPRGKPSSLLDLSPGRLYNGPLSFFDVHFSSRVWMNLYSWVWIEFTVRMIQVPCVSRPSVAKEALGKIVRITLQLHDLFFVDMGGGPTLQPTAPTQAFPYFCSR